MVVLNLLIGFFLLGSTLANPAFNKDEAVKTFQIACEDCRKEVGATSGDVQDLLNRRPPAGMPGKCLRSCLLKKYRVMDSNGKFVQSVALDVARHMTNGDSEKMKLAQDMANACSDIKVSSNHCDAASDYGRCFREQAMQRMHLPEH